MQIKTYGFLTIECAGQGEQHAQPLFDRSLAPFGFLNVNSEFYIRIQCQCGFLLGHNYISKFVNIGLNSYYYLKELLSKVNYFKNYNKCLIIRRTKMSLKMQMQI